MTNKQRYKIFCDEHSEIPLFMQAWWLDAVTMPDGKDWDVLLCEENGKIVGAMPYHLFRKWGLKTIDRTQHTQYHGLWIDYPMDCKPHKRYSFEKRVMDSLIDQLEALSVAFYSQNFHHSFMNWQPFYWRGFRQTTRYTYILKNIADIDTIFDNAHPRYRQKLRKSEKELVVDFNFLPEEFYDFHKNSLSENNDSVNYSNQLFLSIYREATKRKQGKIIAIRNKNNDILSAIFFVWDMNCGYNLITVRKIEDGSNDASIYMIWEAIKYLSDKAKNYDFEGSMIKGVANVNQQFGAEQVPYFNISKCNSKRFALLRYIKTLIR